MPTISSLWRTGTSSNRAIISNCSPRAALTLRCTTASLRDGPANIVPWLRSGGCKLRSLDLLRPSVKRGALPREALGAVLGSANALCSGAGSIAFGRDVCYNKEKAVSAGKEGSLCWKQECRRRRLRSRIKTEGWFRCPIFSVKRWFYIFIRRTTRPDARGRRARLRPRTANLKRKTPSSSASVKTASLRMKSLRKSIICRSSCCPIPICRRSGHTAYGRRKNCTERRVWASSARRFSLTNKAKS